MPRHDAGFDAGTVHDLMARLRHVQTRTSYAEALQSVVDGVVAVAGFDVAIVRTLQDGWFTCEAVAGNPDNPVAAVDCDDLAPIALEEMEREFALGTPLGDLIFVHHSHALPDDGAWVPDIPEPDDPDSWHPLDALYAPMRDGDGTLRAVLGVDLPRWGLVPDERQAEVLALFAGHASLALAHSRLADRLREREREFRLAFDRAVTGMALLHLGDDGRILGGRVNPALCEMLGRTPAGFARTPLADLLAPGQGADLTTFLHEGRGDGIELRALHVDGTQRWVRITSGVVERAAGRTTVVTHVEDIGEQRRRGDELVRQATRDDLTGLWNRRVLDERLSGLVQHAEVSGEPAAVLFVDIDDFKQVNDTYGHLAGDRTLVAVGRRLLGAVRSCDTVIRVGGDEFVVLMPSVPAGHLADVAERVRQRISRRIRVGDEAIHVSVSVGAAQTAAGDGADRLLSRADADMYERKRALAV